MRRCRRPIASDACANDVWQAGMLLIEDAEEVGLLGLEAVGHLLRGEEVEQFLLLLGRSVAVKILIKQLLY